VRGVGAGRHLARSAQRGRFQSALRSSAGRSGAALPGWPNRGAKRLSAVEARHTSPLPQQRRGGGPPPGSGAAGRGAS